MKNTMVDLRNHLFETLEALKDKDEPMDIDRAKTVSQVAQTLIDSAKVEVDYIRVSGDTRTTGFIESDKPKLEQVK